MPKASYKRHTSWFRSDSPKMSGQYSHSNMSSSNATRYFHTQDMSRTQSVSMQRVTKEELNCKTIVGRGSKLPDVVKEAEVNSTSNKDVFLPIHGNMTKVPIEKNQHLESRQVPIERKPNLERKQALFKRNQHLESMQMQIIKNPNLENRKVWIEKNQYIRKTLKCQLKEIQIWKACKSR